MSRFPWSRRPERHEADTSGERCRRRYEGDINKDGTELNGAWTQRGNSIALQFKKAPAAKP